MLKLTFLALIALTLAFLQLNFQLTYSAPTPIPNKNPNSISSRVMRTTKGLFRPLANMGSTQYGQDIQSIKKEIKNSIKVFQITLNTLNTFNPTENKVTIDQQIIQTIASINDEINLNDNELKKYKRNSNTDLLQPLIDLKRQFQILALKRAYLVHQLESNETMDTIKKKESDSAMKNDLKILRQMGVDDSVIKTWPPIRRAPNYVDLPQINKVSHEKEIIQPFEVEPLQEGEESSAPMIRENVKKGHDFFDYLKSSPKIKTSNLQSGSGSRPCIITKPPPLVSLNLNVPTVGLINDNVKCFIISSLQALLHSPLFINAFLKHRQPFNEYNHPVLNALNDLITQMRTLKVPQTFKRFYDVMGKTFKKNRPSELNIFNGEQHDAEEFLSFFIEMIQQEESKLDINPISSLFNGSTEPTLCKPNFKSRNPIETFIIYILSIKGIKTFEESFHESIVSKVEWKIDKTQISTQIHKLDLFKTLPKVLVIKFKRYDYNFVNNVAEYITKVVPFPKGFSIHPDYLVDPNASSRYRLVSGKMSYRVLKVIKHSGRSISAGHYITDSLMGSQWRRFNDDIVSDITEDMAMNDNINNKFNAYVLVYELVD